MPICIAGMHRSGTSMVARLLNLCGVCLGAEDEFIAPAEDNPEGYWENLHFYNINNEILNLFSSGWDLPPRLSAGWERMPELDALRAQAAELVRRFDRLYPRWGWKDPRNSITLPFWQSIIPDLKVVICLRNPLEVAQSLTKRGRASTVFGLDLWRTYNRAVLSAVPPQDRVITDYQVYFQDAPRELVRVLSALGLSAADETVARACESISPELHRNRSGLAELAQAGVPSDIIQLYAALRREATADGDEIPTSSRAGDAALLAGGTSDQTAGPSEPHLRGLLLGTREQLRLRDLEAASLRARVAHLEQELEQEKGKTAWLQEQIDRMQATRFWQAGQSYWRVHERVTSFFKPKAVVQEAVTEPPAARELRELVDQCVPLDARVALVQAENAPLFDLGARPVLPFRTTLESAGGRRALGNTGAIVQLERLRSEGASFLVIPALAIPWYTGVPTFKSYLYQHYRIVAEQPERGLIFAIDASLLLSGTKPWLALNQILERFRLAEGREPEILNWDTGADLAAVLPGSVVFAPPTSNAPLPYLDETIDLVVIPSANPERMAEAQRVARAAVITLTRTPDKPIAESELAVMWKIPRTDRDAMVSIIIPCYNGAEITRACLQALHETLALVERYEIIAVDDASQDETAELLAEWQAREPRVRVLRNETNLGFVASCNRGAMAANGEFLVFLNNDTIPVTGWLEALLETFRAYPDAGAVGARLVLADGSLQEAGCQIFADGSAANFGRGDKDLDAPLYNYVRQVDYCSGACLATPRALFVELNGFDTRYAPAYYEDVDYCFQVRTAGHPVYYQPECIVIHREGATAGTDTAVGVKRYQVINRSRFAEKWRAALAEQPARPPELNPGAATEQKQGAAE